MGNEHTAVRRCTVYRRHGESHAQTLELEPIRLEIPLTRRTTDADLVPLTQIMCRDLVCARPDLEIGAVVSLMVRNRVGCIPVVDERRRPVGVITKLDLVEQIDAFLRSVNNGTPLPIELLARTADEVMMPLALTLDESATVAHAASMMTCEDLHHVLVVSRTGTLVGVVSSKDIVTWLADNDGVRPAVAVAAGWPSADR